jgi:hypothetical protein
LKSRLKNLNGKGNGVIQLFIKLYKKMKMPLGLKWIKKPLENDNQALEAKTKKFA